MLNIECNTCKKRFWVKGYVTADSYYEPGEVVTELECDDELCVCLNDGAEFEVVGFEDERFPDDVF